MLKCIGKEASAQLDSVARVTKSLSRASILAVLQCKMGSLSSRQDKSENLSLERKRNCGSPGSKEKKTFLNHCHKMTVMAIGFTRGLSHHWLLTVMLKCFSVPKDDATECLLLGQWFPNWAIPPLGGCWNNGGGGSSLRCH